MWVLIHKYQQAVLRMVNRELANGSCDFGGNFDLSIISWKTAGDNIKRVIDIEKFKYIVL